MKLVIVAIVAASVGVVLWLKPAPVPEADAQPASAVQPAKPASTAKPVSKTQPASAATTVMLFADPREAGDSCGCGEIIHLARSAKSVEGVAFREIDTRQPNPIAKRYAVRTSPTVLFVDPAGKVRHRFEGESKGVIAKLHTAIDGLSQSMVQAR